MDGKRALSEGGMTAQGYHVYDRNGVLYADVISPEGAVLFAAAKKMLDALEAWSEFDHHWKTCMECQENGQCCENGSGLYEYAVDKAVAALAKARGVKK